MNTKKTKLFKWEHKLPIQQMSYIVLMLQTTLQMFIVETNGDESFEHPQVEKSR
jgi:hypothetical protein